MSYRPLMDWEVARLNRLQEERRKENVQKLFHIQNFPFHNTFNYKFRHRWKDKLPFEIVRILVETGQLEERLKVIDYINNK